MKIILGAPVKGFRLKSFLLNHLRGKGHEVIDVGCYDTDRFVKYTSTGERVAKALQDGQGEVAVNICGSGTGAVMAVNKFSGVLACACESVKTATLARIVNGANCLCLGEDIVSESLACEMVDAFIGSKFLDNPGAAPEIKNFWKEAHDEMIVQGEPARDRDIETL